jgi:DNA (cytosine-5)-methyltransferase 1
VKFLSVCSGIEAASVAWNPLGWKAVAFSEIERFPSAVLAHHYPDVPNLGDMTKFHEWPDLEFDLLVGGTPCQSFSVAGLRKGLADPRGNLALTYLALADRYRPRWLVWENVPGVLSSSKGRDFGAFLGGLGELGYGWSYRVLDAQYCGVPQRRRRVFVVGHSSGDFRRAAEVLFERHSLSGDSAPCRKTGEGITHDAAPCLGASGRGFERAGETRGQDPVIAVSHDPACTLTAREYKGALPEADLSTVIAFSGQMSTPQCDMDLSQTPGAKNPMAVAFEPRYFTRENKTGGAPSDTAVLSATGAAKAGDAAPCVAFQSEKYYSHEYRQDSIHSTKGSADAICPSRTNLMQGYHTQFGVRRLTPKECARLQGFPDDYLDIIYNGKPACDGPKYKALGNSMATPVVRWIGERIQLSDKP